MTALPPDALPGALPSTEAPRALPAAQRPRRHKTARVVAALMLREMATTYGRSPGGYVWAVLEPVGAIALLTLVFSLALRSPSLGDSFPLFYATGYLPFSLYMGLSQKIASSIRYSKALLAYPAVTFADAILARFALNVMTQTMVFCIVIAGIAVIDDLRLTVDVPTALLALALAALLGLGVGVINCFASSMVPAWENVWAIAMRPAFLLSGIFFIYEDLSERFREIIWWNPLFHVTGLMRRAFYPTYDAKYVSVSYVLAVGTLCLFFGLLLLGRYHRDILTNR